MVRGWPNYLSVGRLYIKTIQRQVAAAVLSFGPFITLFCGVVIPLGAVCAVVLMH